MYKVAVDGIFGGEGNNGLCDALCNIGIEKCDNLILCHKCHDAMWHM